MRRVQRCWMRAGRVLGVWALMLGPALAQSPAPADAEPSPEAPRLAVHTGLAEGALQRRFPDRVRWLEPEGGGQTLALWFPEGRPDARGALVLMANEGESAGTDLVLAVAEALADAGWAVLTLGLEPPTESVRARLERAPTVPGQTPPPAPGVMIDVLATPASEGAEADYRARVQGQLQAAVAWLAGQGYGPLGAVGIGRAAFYVVAPDLGQASVPFRVWVAPAFYPGCESELAQRLAAPQGLALLELYPVVEARSGRARWVTARRAGFSDYQRQPVAMAVPPGPAAAQALANRILAWLGRRSGS